MLESIWLDLRSSNNETRVKAAKNLRTYISSLNAGSSTDLTRFMNDVNKRIFELVHSADINDKIGGLLAIDNLIEDLDGDIAKIARFANYLRVALPGNDMQVTILASKTLGHLAELGATITAEFVEFEVKRSLEWLSTTDKTDENRRYSATLVIKELSSATPTLLYAYVPQVIDLIWNVLWDSKLVIRNAAADALRETLGLINQRESSRRKTWYSAIFGQIQKGIRIGSLEHVHGSLLALAEHLSHSGVFTDNNRYIEISEMVLKFKDHRDVLVRKQVILLIPCLASFDPSSFISKHLEICMSYLLAQIKKDRSLAFTSIGKLSLVVKADIKPFLDKIMFHIKESFNVAKSNNNWNEENVFDCISLLCESVGPHLSVHMENPELLDLIFSVGLSESLRRACVDLTTYIPTLLPSIQDRLLRLISILLVGKKYQHPGCPYPEKIISDFKANRPEDVILALNILGTFNFSNHMLSKLVGECCMLYLEDEDVQIRKSCIVTCCLLLASDPICFQTSNNSLITVTEILSRLLTVAITDVDPLIRRQVLTSLLDQRFDHHLAYSGNIRTLFFSLNDADFGIRELAMEIIGRLGIHNPAYIMPSLRKTLIMVLTELEFSNVLRQKEESAQLLCLLISKSHKLVQPYVEPILRVLLPKSKDPSPAIAAKVLSAIGELSVVGGAELVSWLDDLLPIIIENLQDQSSMVKREAALKTLGQLITSTGWVVEPYVKYPNLLDLLIDILKTEQIGHIREEAVKVMGIIGAIDPYKHKMTTSINTDDLIGMAVNDIPSLPLNISPSHEDYYPTVAVNALMKFLKDPSLAMHHTAVVQALMYLFKTIGLKCVPFLPQIMPPFLSMMRTSPSLMLEFYFQQLALLISIIKQHIRNYFPDILSLINDFWQVPSNNIGSIQTTILSVIEAIAIALDGEFKVYLPKLLPEMLQIFDTDTTERKGCTQKVLSVLVVFGINLEEYLHLLVPAIVKLLERPDVNNSVKKNVIKTTGLLIRKISFVSQVSRIIHPLLKILACDNNTGENPQVLKSLKETTMDTICIFIYQLQNDFLVFAPMLTKAMKKYDIHYPKYDLLVSKLSKGEALPELDIVEADERKPDESPSAESSSAKLPVNQQQLQKAWETSQKSTKEDWHEWIRRFSVELLKESPSHSLRSCASLASIYYPLARELFNAAFVSCWGELLPKYQEELVKCIESALHSFDIPLEVLQTLLNLAEFMEHDDKALPIEIQTLGIYAAKCHAYAKALHYKELEFISEPLTDTIEALISINNQLQQPDSAVGILTYAQQIHDVQLKESWYEKLQRWDDGLTAYEKKQQEDPSSVEATAGRMRCLHNLGEWESLSVLAQEKWSISSEDVKTMMASMAAAAAWGLGQWEMMDEYISVMKQESPDSAFFKAIIAIHRSDFPGAKHFIELTRELLDTELMALVGESYNRAYSVVVRIQMLAELDEIILYKQYYDAPEKQSLIRKSWTTRLIGCQRNVEVWQRILRVRALVIPPKDDKHMWIKFSNLCRKSGRLGASSKTLITLLDNPVQDFASLDVVSNNPHVIYACLKHLWTAGTKNVAFHKMKAFSKHLVEVIGATTRSSDVRNNSGNELISLLARCYLKVGDWHIALQKEWHEVSIPDILNSYLAATQCDKDWYKAWHAWAFANFEVLNYYDNRGTIAKNEATNFNPESHVIASVRGFFRSISLAVGNSLQDTLRLLTLWFKYGAQQSVHSSITEGFGSISIDTWLQVIPQLIARIHIANPQIRKSIHQLLCDVGKEHPQALIYSITVATKSSNADRKDAALAIMDKMRTHSPRLVEQALLVSQELIRVAILWHEMWHEGLEEASRQYFGEKNMEGMLSTLEPLHIMLERGPETLKEMSFNQAFGNYLQEAMVWCEKYKRTRNQGDLDQAWDLYYNVFREINKRLPQLTTLELQFVSPQLLEARSLDIAVPGTYKSGEPVIKIESFNSTLTVISSKQRPRKLTIKGSDGKDYHYLLKGHEDLRQDERVMQLFGLVNTLLGTDDETFKRHLQIQRYPVIPLSPISGLIGWVPHCDTLHACIRDYREGKKILINIEHRLMLQMAPDYERLTLLQKVEVFEYALENTTGQDLYKVLWLKSKNSEIWLDRRTNYTRSLAVMSMVGYILGLGDRHPSNLMLDRVSGKVIHIDFGDCFEVAMHREKFPELIPFRLTRMLINAMEVSGIEGNYRITCQHVMRVLRENKDSLMAVLEAFVHDPLINWRLLSANSPKRNDDPESLGGSRMLSLNPDFQSSLDEPSHSRKYPPSRKPNYSEEDLTLEGQTESTVNQKALKVIQRVSNKLTGRDFNADETLDVNSQVQRLILQATSLENLCQCYIGWCSFW